MSHGPFWTRRPGPARLAQLLQEQSTEQLTYSEVGATAGELPSGYHPVRASITVGQGDGVFERATEGIRAWAPQRAAGFDFVPVRPPLEVGQSLVLVFRSFPFFVTGAARVVYVVDEEDRFGFAYGTLPGHPESGEEAFIVERTGGEVRFRITGFSRPQVLLTRLGGPVARMVQARTTRRYLEGLVETARLPP